MTRDELVAIVRQSNADTLLAARMREVLGLPKLSKRRRYRDKGAKSRKYRGARKLMKQRHGVKL